MRASRKNSDPSLLQQLPLEMDMTSLSEPSDKTRGPAEPASDSSLSTPPMFHSTPKQDLFALDLGKTANKKSHGHAWQTVALEAPSPDVLVDSNVANLDDDLDTSAWE